MDDIRRPQPQLPRRDYSLPPNQPPRPQPQQPAEPVGPTPMLPPTPSPAPAEPLLYNNPPVSHSRQDYDFRHQAPTQPLQPAVKSGFSKFLSPKIMALAAVVIIVLVAGGFYLTKPAKKTGITAAQLAKKSSFSFYYPQPLTDGYSYVGDLNAFQGNQAYYMLANGKRHIVIHELAASSDSRPAETPANAQNLSSSIGKVNLGITAGEPSAQIIAGSTYILINTTGSVPQTDLVNTINSLKIIK